MVNSRNKGSQYERSICQLFNLELGSQFNFKRDLEQYRSADHGDIITDDPTWPFVVELKRYASGPASGQTAWWRQAVNAATAADKLPVLIYKYDRADPVCVIQKKTIARALGLLAKRPGDRLFLDHRDGISPVVFIDQDGQFLGGLSLIHI